MTLKETAKINDLICALWDFFTSNTNSDETGLVDSLVPLKENVDEIISNEFYKLHLRNALAKVRKTLKQKPL